MKYYIEVAGKDENINLEYEANNLVIDNLLSKDSIKESLTKHSNQIIDSEIRRGTTLFGPQKDDLIIKINNGIAKEFASQGQHKSLLIALKFAEFEFLKDMLNETPIILLDDIFSELDDKRSKLVLDLY